jgi:hypothetical protein
MKEFKDLEFQATDSFLNGIKARVQFPNGYGASIIKNEYSYGGPEGLYELAVLKDGSLCYNTPITDDVIGWCDENKITELLLEIQKL